MEKNIDMFWLPSTCESDNTTSDSISTLTSESFKDPTPSEKKNEAYEVLNCPERFYNAYNDLKYRPNLQDIREALHTAHFFHKKQLGDIFILKESALKLSTKYQSLTTFNNNLRKQLDYLSSVGQKLKAEEEDDNLLISLRYEAESQKALLKEELETFDKLTKIKTNKDLQNENQKLKSRVEELKRHNRLMNSENHSIHSKIVKSINKIEESKRLSALFEEQKNLNETNQIELSELITALVITKNCLARCKGAIFELDPSLETDDTGPSYLF